MLMKYKDFKQLSNEDMKSIQGGYLLVCACTSSSGMYSNACYVSSFAGGTRCFLDAQSHCPGSAVDCVGGPQK